MTSAVQSASQRDAILSALNVSRDTAASKTGELENRFLTLLTTQLRNQDPLNPMDNAQMTMQMAQISTVDGIERLNKTLQVLMDNSAETQAVQAALLVGHGVLAPGKGMEMRDGLGIAGFELAEPADRVTATIKDSHGIALRTLDLGARGAGTHSFQWDGNTDAGVAAASGRYSVALSAQRGADAVKVDGLELAVVSGVARSGGEVSLDLGALGMFRLSDVKRII